MTNQPLNPRGRRPMRTLAQLSPLRSILSLRRLGSGKPGSFVLTSIEDGRRDGEPATTDCSYGRWALVAANYRKDRTVHSYDAPAIDGATLTIQKVTLISGAVLKKMPAALGGPRRAFLPTETPTI